MISGNHKGVLAVTGAYTIYGLNVVFCKDLVNSPYVDPTVLVSARLGVAAILFWIVSIFTEREKIEKKDYMKLFAAAMLAMFLPHLTMLWGLTMSTPFDVSLISTIKPLTTFALSCIILHEKFSLNYLAGLLTAMAGAVLLVWAGASNREFATSVPGLVILILNALSFSLYLVLFRPLISKYKVVTTQKWMLLFAFLVSIPFSIPGLEVVRTDMLTPKMWLEFGFLAFFATFVTFFLTPIGQKNLTPTRYSIYSYFQLIVAAVAGTAMGVDSLNGWKILAAVLIVGGVWIHRHQPFLTSRMENS